MPKARSFPAAVLDGLVVYVDDLPFTASYSRQGKVLVQGAPRKIAPATRVASEIQTREGNEVKTLLRGEGVPVGDVDSVLASALIVSPHVGHTRDEGKAPRFIWTDHVALVLGLDPREALPYSHPEVQTSQVNTRSALQGASGGNQRDHRPTSACRARTRRRPLQGNYRAANGSRPRTRRDPFPFDPNERDRKTREHGVLQDRIERLAAEAGHVSHSPEPPDPDYDIDVTRGDGTEVLIEVKTLSTANERSQMRLGVGQLLDYQHQLRLSGVDVDLVLVVDRQPTDPEWVALLAHHGINLFWPDTLPELF